MNSKTTEEEERLIIENMRLVPHMVKQAGIDRSSCYYEDLVQIGYIGLIKAARTFNSDKARFVRYACICIRNEIFMFLRKECKIPSLISLEEECTTKYDSLGLTYEDIIEDENANFSERFYDRELLKRTLLLILNCFTTNEKAIMLYGISGLSQQDISKIVNLTQPSVSRAQKRVQISLKQLINANVIFERRYKGEVLERFFRIKCKVCNIKDFNSFLENLEYEIKSINSNHIFSFRYIANELIMEFPIEITSCYIIARVIQVIEDYD